MLGGTTAGRIAAGAAILAIGLVLPVSRRLLRPRRRRQVLVALSFIIFVSYLVAGPDGVSLPRDALVVLLAGQSNMAGRGGVVRLGETMKLFQPQTEQERALLVGDESVLRLTASLQWVKAVEPLHFDIDTTKVCGIGPGLIFARELLKARTLGRTKFFSSVALVPCAVGGTKIDEWSRDGALYQSMLLRAKVASRDNGIEAILWYQGESDGQREEDADRYESRLHEFIRNIREDLGNVKLIMVIISANPTVLPFQNRIRDVIRAVPATFADVQLVDALGLPLLEDGLHLSSTAQFVLGEQLAETYLRM